MQTEAET
jgi:hypothetical protein